MATAPSSALNLADAEDEISARLKAEYNENEIYEGLYGERKFFTALTAPASCTSDVWKHYLWVYMLPEDGVDMEHELHSDYFTGFVVHRHTKTVMKKQTTSNLAARHKVLSKNNVGFAFEADVLLSKNDNFPEITREKNMMADKIADYCMMSNDAIPVQRGGFVDMIQHAWDRGAAVGHKDLKPSNPQLQIIPSHKKVTKTILKKKDTLMSEIIPKLRKAQNHGKLVCSADIGQTASGTALLGATTHWVEDFELHSISLGTHNFEKLVLLPQKDDEDILKVLDINTGDLVDSDDEILDESENSDIENS